MTMMPMYKTCSKCKRKYSWNPDVGRMLCPYCGQLSVSGAEDILWRKIKDVFKGKKK